MTKFKHIIFDFDGTIADTSHIIIATMQATMREMRLDVATPEAIKQVIGLPLKDCFSNIYNGMSEQEAGRCAETYCRIFDINKESLTPALFPLVKETLNALRRMGITLCVASSRSHGSLTELLEMMGVRQLFAMIVGVDDVAHAKPHPEAVLRIHDAMGMDREVTLMVGDMPVDIAMGRNAGIRTCAVTYGNSSRMELTESHPDFIIDGFDKLIRVI